LISSALINFNALTQLLLQITILLDDEIFNFLKKYFT